MSVGTGGGARSRGVLYDPLVSSSNTFFFLYNVASYAFATVTWKPPLSSLVTSGRPVIFFAWHANAWASMRMFRDAGIKPWVVAHDGLISQINCRAGKPWGLDAFTFTRAGPVAPREQIAEFVRSARHNLLLFPDSGGPYRRMRGGIVEIGRTTDALLVPFALATRGAIRVGGRQGHILGVPFCKLTGLLGAPIDGKEASLEGCQRALDDLEDAVRQARRDPT